LRSDLGTVIGNDTLAVGGNMLAAGAVFPASSSYIAGTLYNWSRIATLAGNHVISGPTLFTKRQAPWDPRLVWDNGTVKKRVPVYWSGTGIPANTYIKGFTETTLTTRIAHGRAGARRRAGEATARCWPRPACSCLPPRWRAGWPAAGSTTRA
jgi:hypothetical protein